MEGIRIHNSVLRLWVVEVAFPHYPDPMSITVGN